MFSYVSTSPCEIQGTIKLSKPLSGLGPVVDVNGKRWDIHGIIGDYVQAALESELHPYYNDTSTASYGFVSQSWKPYRISVEQP